MVHTFNVEMPFVEGECVVADFSTSASDVVIAGMRFIAGLLFANVICVYEVRIFKKGNVSKCSGVATSIS